MKRKFIYSTLFLMTLSLIQLKAQDLTISNVKVYRITSVDQNTTTGLQVSFELSDLSTTPTIEVRLGRDQNCKGFFIDLYHIKNYSDGYYLKHKSTLHKLGGTTISFKMELDDMTFRGGQFLCIMTKDGEKITSNTVTAELPK